LFLSTL